MGSASARNGGRVVRTYGLTHIALGVRDVERSALFYKQVFGSIEVYRQDGFVQLQTPGTRDVLVLRGRHQAGRPERRHRALRLPPDPSRRYRKGSRGGRVGRWHRSASRASSCRASLICLPVIPTVTSSRIWYEFADAGRSGLRESINRFARFADSVTPVMSFETWLLFVMTDVVICLTPGPAVLLVLSLSLTRGVYAGWRAGSRASSRATGIYFFISATSLGRPAAGVVGAVYGRQMGRCLLPRVARDRHDRVPGCDPGLRRRPRRPIAPRSGHSATACSRRAPIRKRSYSSRRSSRNSSIRHARLRPANPDSGPHLHGDRTGGALALHRAGAAHARGRR